MPGRIFFSSYFIFLVFFWCVCFASLVAVFICSWNIFSHYILYNICIYLHLQHTQNKEISIWFSAEYSEYKKDVNLSVIYIFEFDMLEGSLYPEYTAANQFEKIFLFVFFLVWVFSITISQLLHNFHMEIDNLLKYKWARARLDDILSTMVQNVLKFFAFNFIILSLIKFKMLGKSWAFVFFHFFRFIGLICPGI